MCNITYWCLKTFVNKFTIGSEKKEIMFLKHNIKVVVAEVGVIPQP